MTRATTIRMIHVAVRELGLDVGTQTGTVGHPCQLCVHGPLPPSPERLTLCNAFFSGSSYLFLDIPAFVQTLMSMCSGINPWVTMISQTTV